MGPDRLLRHFGTWEDLAGMRLPFSKVAEALLGPELPFVPGAANDRSQPMLLKNSGLERWQGF